MDKFGIDVSIHQKGFNFTKAKAEGVDFAIIKCSQANYKDSAFESHYKNAKAVGIGVGAYHFCTARNATEAAKEAQTCLNAIKGKQFEYPIFLDFEDYKVKYSVMNKQTNDSIIKAFCDVLEKAGYWVGLYTGIDFYRNRISGAELAKRYSFWLAYWGTKPPVDCQMWQFGGETNKLRTNKVAGVVCDQNYCYVDYPTMIKKNKLNGFGNNTTVTTTTPAATTISFDKGEKVKLKTGATYYNGQSIPAWVKARTLYIRSVELTGGNYNVSILPEGGITGRVNKKYLTKA